MCNAGVQVVSGTEWTQDGVEVTFGVNHLGHFGLVQGLLGELALPARVLVVSVSCRLLRSTRTSGRYLAALANDARFDGVTGKYFDGCKPIRSSAESYDRDKALDLWETSERLLTHATK